MDHMEYARIAFPEDKIHARIAELGKQITEDYAGKDLILIGVLKGSLYFLADLSRAIDLPVQIDFISIGMYPNSTGQTGVVRITKDLDYDIFGKHVLVIEDIMRSGLTTGYLMQNLEARGAASIQICTLLINPDQQLINIPVAYSGFEVSETRLVGYGMDVDEKGRNIPYIAEL